LVGLIEPFSVYLPTEPPLLLESECRSKLRPSFLSMHVNERREGRTVGRGPLQNNSTFEIETECNAFFNFFITSLLSNPAYPGSGYRILVNQPARGVNAINAKVR